MRAMAQGGTPRPLRRLCEQSAPAQPSKHSQRRMLHTPWPEHALLQAVGARAAGERAINHITSIHLAVDGVNSPAPPLAGPRAPPAPSNSPQLTGHRSRSWGAQCCSGTRGSTARGPPAPRAPWATAWLREAGEREAVGRRAAVPDHPHRRCRHHPTAAAAVTTPPTPTHASTHPPEEDVSHEQLVCVGAAAVGGCVGVVRVVAAAPLQLPCVAIAQEQGGGAALCRVDGVPRVGGGEHLGRLAVPADKRVGAQLAARGQRVGGGVAAQRDDRQRGCGRGRVEGGRVGAAGGGGGGWRAGGWAQQAGRAPVRRRPARVPRRSCDTRSAAAASPPS